MKQQEKENQDLVKQIQAGHTEAFRPLIERYQRLVGHVVYRMISNPADSEDLCQDIFLKIFQNLSSFRFESKVSTWIAKIAYHACINHLKKKKAVLFDDHTSEYESLDSLSGDYILPDVYTEKEEQAILLENEIDKLNIPFRSILTLYHLEGMSYAEIGQIMNLPEGTIKSYLFRARKHLRKRLVSKYTKEEIWR